MNTYKLGDFVRLVEEDAEGYITAILKDGMIAVTGKDGFEIPVLATKVTLVHGKMDTEEDRKDTSGGPVPQSEFIPSGVYLAIVGDQKQGLVEFFLVNESSYILMAGFNTNKGNKLKGEFAGRIAPHSYGKIYTANASLVGNWPLFNIQIIFFSENLLDIKKPLTIDKKIRPVDLSTAKKEVVMLGKKAWLFQLDESAEALDTDKLQEHFFSHRPTKK